MSDIVRICTIHGELTKEKCILNRISPKGKIYWRCRVCRNLTEKNRLDKTIYLYTPRKHIKHKLPDFVKQEDKSHAYTMLHRFKVTAIQYREMQNKQNNCCAICKKPETQFKIKSKKIKMLAIDHCHSTGKIRGLLCQNCNIALGGFKDSIETLQSAIKYLMSFSLPSSLEDSHACEDQLKV